ncbi:MAG: universal stress protein [Bacteroidales bacterium]|nr:universal stress protein [Bacteroidales bacterium]MBN2756113.1 universal stress protein [Bacteroidales bacterium]
MDKPILVPWDFSQVAENALLHAINFSKTTGEAVALVHVVKKKKEIDSANLKLEEVVSQIKDKYGIELGVFVREGSIFTAITEVVEEVNANLVVMGTHGMKGMQKFTGSWALKVIAGSKAPFVVVQDEPKGELKDIVFPVDFKGEQKEKLVWAGFLVNHFKVKIHIVYQGSNDSRIKAKTKSNIVFSRNYLAEKGGSFEIKELPGEKSLADEAIDYAKDNKAGMILIMTTKNISFQDYVLGADEQQLIANTEKIPVMCINPKKGSSKYGGFSASGS